MDLDDVALDLSRVCPSGNALLKPMSNPERGIVARHFLGGGAVLGTASPDNTMLVAVERHLDRARLLAGDRRDAIDALRMKLFGSIRSSLSFPVGMTRE